MKDNLLIEIGTEELPPKALLSLSDTFAENIERGIHAAEFDFTGIKRYATPRRLAVVIEDLEADQAGRVDHRRGPAVKVAFDDSGEPTKAAQGFARACGVTVADLGRIKNVDGEWLAFELHVAGRTIDDVLPDILAKALADLPIPKRMRWGERTTEFVRPAHWLVMLYGDRVIDCEVLELRAGRTTRGHRFHHTAHIELAHADDYATTLEDPGHVIGDFSKRRQCIRELVETCATEHQGTASIDPALLDEVTALVEWPVVISGSFDKHFLELPAEVLVASMQDHQKYFPITDANGQLVNRFISISNIESLDPETVRSGNERVIRPRLSDAGFFWKNDCAKRLEDRLDLLADMLFEKRLGSLLDKTRRVEHLAQRFAAAFGVENSAVARAARLSRCDLLSEMVGEFPELQGTMGRYYALADGEPEIVCEALGEFYKPRYAGDTLPATPSGACIALADKLDTLVGIFGIGSAPTGDKDPYALRRAAIGLLRILIEGEIDLDLREAIVIALNAYGDIELLEGTAESVFAYIRDRMRGYYLEHGAPPDVCDAVFANDPPAPLEVARRLDAVCKFREMDAAAALASANKRIANILKKLEAKPRQTITRELLVEPQEKALVEQYDILADQAEDLFARRAYPQYMELLASLRDPVDAFFDHVMVMCDDDQLRDNRIALLLALHGLFTRVADIAKLHDG